MSSPSSRCDHQQSLRFLLGGSDSDSDSEAEAPPAKRRLCPTTPPRKRALLIKGNVTPSKAFPLFKKAAPVGLPTPPSSSPRSFTSAEAPTRGLCAQEALWALKSRRGLHAFRPRIDHSEYLATFVSPHEGVHRLDGNAHPLCSAYSFSSRAVSPHAQWLAVGDDEGRITLINTLPPQHPAAEVYTATPQWSATDPAAPASIFELAWRYDDRVILTGGSDYIIRSWDVETQTLIRAYEGHRGSPKTIVWDPTGGGDVFASAGRDGGIQIWDARTGSAPVLSVWEAHASLQRRARKKSMPPPKGVTALCYIPDGKLVSAGCENAVLKCWDPRAFPAKTPRKKTASAEPAYTTPDLSMRDSHSRRPHGVSDLVTSSHQLFASSTDGRIYPLSLADFAAGTPLFHPTQRQNTLYAKMALYDDKFLALGCNSGSVALWDVQSPSPGFAFEEEATREAVGVRSGGAVLLQNGHEGCEINSLSWANGVNGPCLATVGDDMGVRTWWADRRRRQYLAAE